MGRIILHIDMNKYYASVEQMLNPALKNKAIAVCGSAEEHHGIVLTASAEAKACGVKTGMANWEARKMCPGLIVVPPQYDQYVKYSRLARAIYARYSDLIEPYGMDECWVEITKLCSSFKEAEQVAHEIRRTIKAELGLTVSIGVATCYCSPSRKLERESVVPSCWRPSLCWAAHGSKTGACQHPNDW